MAQQSIVSVEPISLRPATDWSILVRCYSYLRPYWKLTAGAYGMLVAITLLNLTIPQLIRWIVDRGIGNQDRTLLTWSVVALLLITLVRGVATFFQGRWSEVMSQGVAYNIRNAIYHKLAELSFAYHDRTETGQLLSRAVQDVERIRFLTGRAVLRILDSAVLLFGTAIVLILMNPALALMSLFMMPLLAYRAYEFGRRLRPVSLAIQQQVAVLTTRIEQNLRGAARR